MDEHFQAINRTFERGEIIFNEGNPNDGIYLIRRGRVKIFKRIYKNGKTIEYELAKLGENKIFGEMAVLGDGVRTASVKAITKTSCIIITKNCFESHISKLPDWVTMVIKNLVQRLHISNEKLKEYVETSESVT